MEFLLAKIRVYNKDEDHNISLLCFKNYDAAKRCYRSDVISYNEVTRLIFETKEAFHKKFNNNKIILILETKKTNYIIIHKVLCDDSVFWVYDYNIEIIK